MPNNPSIFRPVLTRTDLDTAEPGLYRCHQRPEFVAWVIQGHYYTDADCRFVVYVPLYNPEVPLSNLEALAPSYPDCTFERIDRNLSLRVRE